MDTTEKTYIPAIIQKHAYVNSIHCIYYDFFPLRLFSIKYLVRFCGKQTTNKF